MKKLMMVLFLGLVILPFGVKAASQKYETLNLKEALTQEKIEFDLSKYKETDDQITIYLFRGNGCSYCRSFLEFLNSIVPEYGKYFKVESYETWYNQDNYKFMLEVSTFLGQPAGGVPYIIIGDQVFPGYASSYDEKIKKAIVDLYNSDDRYDVMEEMEKANKPDKSGVVNTWLIIGVNLAIVVFGAISIIYCDYKQHKILFNKLDKIDNELSLLNSKKEEIVSVKEEIKDVEEPKTIKETKVKSATKVKTEAKDTKKATKTKTTSKSKNTKSKTAKK